jgi:hypothetical protein
MIIIIVLKLNLGVNTKQDPGHSSGGSTWIDLGKSKNKNYYYYNFKTGPRVDLG